MELFLIRHAESFNNIRKNDYERVSDPEITDNGRLQINHLADFIHNGLHLPVADHEKNETVVDELVSNIVNANKFPIGLGGEHSLTPPAVKALHAKYPTLSVVILDAHLDFRKEYEGNPLSHATVTRRVSEIVGIELSLIHI